MSGRLVLQFCGSIYSFSSPPGKGELLSNHFSSAVREYQSIKDVHHKDNTAQAGLGDRFLKKLTDFVAGN